MKNKYKEKILMSAEIVLLTLVMTTIVASAAPCKGDSCVGSVTVGPQVGTLTFGTGGSVTYLITVTRGTSSGAFNVDLNIKPKLPSRASDSFSPRKVNFGVSDTSQTSILTVTTKDATPAGQSSFTVDAKKTGQDKQTGIGILTIGPTHPVSELSTSILSITGLVGLFGLVRLNRRKW